MQTLDGEHWEAETVVMSHRQRRLKSMEYVYQVENADGEILRREWNLVGRVYAADESKNYVFEDHWRDKPLNFYLYTKAYRTTMRSQSKGDEPEPLALPLFRKTILFRVSAPQLKEGELLGLIGNHPALGGWNPTRYLRMMNVGADVWMLSVNVDGIILPIEYKYVVIDGKTNHLKQWEDGDNRSISTEVQDGQVCVYSGDALRLPEAMWRGAGVVVPLFSLKTESSCGVGDMGDLNTLIAWASKVGMRMIQLLPLNDTTATHSWTDSHPYNCISCFALHPIYLDLKQLGDIDDEKLSLGFSRQRRELNTLPEVDYPTVYRVKQSYVDAIFKTRGEADLASEAFRSFYQKSESWLLPYAAFCVLRDKNGTARTADWGDHRVYDDSLPLKFLAEDAPEREAMRKVFFVQFHLYEQLKRAVDNAHAKGVALKGDLPVGIYRDSVETWTHPEFFNLDEQMGTPPDKFQPHGQNWGFPTYRWEEKGLMEWYRKRLAWMEQFFDALRIDHVVGFFRVWSIPEGYKSGTMGHFSPGLPLSEEEIGHWGLEFRRELMTRPFVNEGVLQKMFGIHASYVREHFLETERYGIYRLKAGYRNQRDICRHFEGLHDENSLWICEGLCRLVTNVLFVEDKQQGLYHPRFGVYNEPVYDILSADEKDAFMRLYNNYYYERHNDFWAMKADRKFAELLASTRMLICAEDLGLLPKCVSSVLDAQRMLTLEVQDMPKEHGYEFSHLDAYPYRSVATFSTHDMSPMRLWWEENAGRTQRYYATMLQKEGRAPKQLPSRVAEEIVARHLYCPSMLCLLSIQDWLAMDNLLRSKDVYAERINSPYDSYNQWKYRMNVTIEELLDAKQFNMKLRTMIERSKRTKAEGHV
ncbi:MAG: 4-alpha-glucanotransferase [Prevotella sp.]|nr:4-alpha-glucanotransferase [Prevotella sp.]